MMEKAIHYLHKTSLAGSNQIMDSGTNSMKEVCSPYKLRSTLQINVFFVSMQHRESAE